MKQSLLAEKLGVTRTAVSLWETDKNGPVMATLMKMAKIIPLEIEGVTSGKLEDAGYVQYIPVVGEVRAGAWLEIDGESEVSGSIPLSVDLRYRNQRQFALKVVGTSMNKVVRPGVFVVVADWTDNGSDISEDDLVVVRRERAHTYEVTLKRVKKGEKAWELWPESDDPRHQEPIRLANENPDWEVAIVGKVIGKYEPL
jgi:SOS-response transcriptional repressor LexA